MGIDYLVLAVAIGFAVGAILAAYQKRLYQQILVQCAKAYSAEKLCDGNFYYIVPADKYMEMKQAHSDSVLREHMSWLQNNKTKPPRECA